MYCEILALKNSLCNIKLSHLFPHKLHSWLLIPLCVLLCAIKLVYLEKALPQMEQTKLFSLACARVCSNNLNDCENDLPHSLHGNGFSPVWILRCRVKSSDLLNPFPHSLHKCGFAPSWTYKKYLEDYNFFLNSKSSSVYFKSAVNENTYWRSINT